MAGKSLKTSWIILTVVKCVILLIGLLLTFLPEQMFLTSIFQTYVGEEWAGFKAAQEAPAAYFVNLQRELGIFVLICGFYGLIVVLNPYRRAEKWAWWLSLGGNTAGWAAAIAMNVVLKQTVPTAVFAVLLAVAWVGLAVGAKGVLRKTAS